MLAEIDRLLNEAGAVRWSRTWEEGSHNEESYCGLLGLTAAELEALRESGVV